MLRFKVEYQHYLLKLSKLISNKRVNITDEQKKHRKHRLYSLNSFGVEILFSLTEIDEENVRRKHNQ